MSAAQRIPDCRIDGIGDENDVAIAGLGSRRLEVMVCVQFEARTALEAKSELRQVLRELRTDYVDALTFYYVEVAEEWQQIIEPGGALEFCREAQRGGAKEYGALGKILAG